MLLKSSLCTGRMNRAYEVHRTLFVDSLFYTALYRNAFPKHWGD